MRKKSSTNELLGRKRVKAGANGNRSQAGSPAPRRTTGLAGLPMRPEVTGPKSLIKPPALAADRAVPRHQATTAAPATGVQRRKTTPSEIWGNRQQKIEERIVAATEELSAGITE